jgi:hypothetical protein
MIRVFKKCWPTTKVDCANMRRAVGALNDARVHAVGRQTHGVRYFNVGRRETNGAPAFVAVHHYSAHAERTTQQVCSNFNLTARERATNGSGTYGFGNSIWPCNKLHWNNFEVVLLAQLSQQRDIPSALMTKMEIFANDNELCSQCLHKHPAHKLGWVFLSGIGVEPNDKRCVNAGSR